MEISKQRSNLDVCNSVNSILLVENNFTIFGPSMNRVCNFTFSAVCSLKAGCADALITPLTVDTFRTILTWVGDTFVND